MEQISIKLRTQTGAAPQTFDRLFDRRFSHAGVATNPLHHAIERNTSW